MKKTHSPNWGGAGRGQGRKPHCAICKEKIERADLTLGEAIMIGRNYLHNACIESALRAQAQHVEEKPED